jgi:NTE family protein
MASAAMPFIFPAVRIDNDYYGDGSMRQIAPLSPALHLGADRLLVISVGRMGAPWLDRTASHKLDIQLCMAKMASLSSYC